MMRITAAVACFIVAINCYEMGTGDAPQNIFSAGSLWVWYVISLAWCVNGAAVLVGGTDA